MTRPHDGALRIALLATWDERCAWCRRWISAAETEIDHVIPQSVMGDELAELLKLHGLSNRYDKNGTVNLVPACKRCNRFKGARPAPNTPIIAFFLHSTAQKSVTVDARVTRLVEDASIEKAIATIAAAYPNADITREALDDLNKIANDAESAIDEAIGATVKLHPSLGGLFNAAAWRVVSEVGAGGVVIVTNGQRAGYTSSNPIMACGSCGSHGPWNGARCGTCGMLDDGD